jgi:hypothetical protein
MKTVGSIILAAVAFLGFNGLWQRPAMAQVACGAILTSDTTLTATDPVVTTACPKSGLILGDSITLDCNGLTIKGKNKGDGIGVASGVEGATIQNCAVDNFETGITLGGLGSHYVDGVVVTRNKMNGIDVITDFNWVNAAVSRGNGRIGIQVKGDGNEVDGSVALENGRAGFYITGKNHYFDTNFSISNGEEGFSGSGRAVTFSLNNAISNKRDGLIYGGGSKNEPNDFSENKAIGNGGNGIVVSGSNPDANIDDGDNRGIANSGPIQCQIAGQTCF